MFLCQRVNHLLSVIYIWCDNMSCHIMVCLCHILSYDAISYYVISYYTMSFYIMSYHIISYTILYHIILYYTISYHIMSFYIPSEEAIFLVVKSPFFQHKSPPLRGSTCHPSSAKWGWTHLLLDQMGYTYNMTCRGVFFLAMTAN